MKIITKIELWIRKNLLDWLDVKDMSNTEFGYVMKELNEYRKYESAVLNAQLEELGLNFRVLLKSKVIMPQTKNVDLYKLYKDMMIARRKLSILRKYDRFLKPITKKEFVLGYNWKIIGYETKMCMGTYYVDEKKKAKK